MLIGTMNHPENCSPAPQNIEVSLADLRTRRSAKWLGAGPDVIRASYAEMDFSLAPAVQEALRRADVDIVGHTAYYLPLTSPFESIRRAAIDELKHCLDAFARIGAKWMNLHPGRKPPLHDWKFTVEQNLRTLHDIIPTAQDLGVGLMIENLPGEFNSVRELSELLDPLPDLGLHLDIGHSNLMVERNTADDILAAYGKRLCHVHLHDNKGGSADLHLPLGTGLVDTAHYVRSLRSIGYDGTITLEVFTPDRHYLAHSRDVLRKLWDEAAPQPAQKVTGPALAAARN